MSDIRLIALDLDGTLLNSEKRLSVRTRKALECASSKGVHIVPTTGRFYGLLPECIRALEFVRYAITINGAEVYDSKTRTVVARAEIPVETAIGVMQRLLKYDVIFDCYRFGWGWITKAFQDKAKLYAPDGHYLDMILNYRHEKDDLIAHLEATKSEGNVQKVMMFTRTDDHSDLKKAVRDEIIGEYPSLIATDSVWNNLEFNIATANKGEAVKKLAESLGFSMDNVMAFGDGMNDYSMVRDAAIGVAMGNSMSGLKNVAKIIAPTNDEDGVAEVIERCVL
jgi:Cof subfamily protein (haloacid dehalogenase superfamily)